MNETTILIRLGRVLYWTVCALASLPFLFGLWLSAASSQDTHSDAQVLGWFIAGCIGAALVWVIGRGIRYVLANE